MTETASPSSFASTRSTYVALWTIGSVLYAGLLVAGYPLVGVAAFAVGGVVAIALQKHSDAQTFDERDREVFGEAGRHTIALVGMASAVVFPTMVVASAVGYAEWPLWLAYAGYFVAALFAVWLVFVLLARWRRR
jgi:uncharacterized membrane protein